jgi:NAD(P)-dependent dehydrogenase (short-subunit alcohol dehydrogenase family)
LRRSGRAGGAAGPAGIEFISKAALRTVLVTGASSGIGAACARRLSRGGWRVLAGVRRKGDAPEGADEELLLDVTDEEQVRVAAGRVDELHGLVNNAGIAVAAPLELLPLEELRRQLEVNVVGQVAVTQALLPQLRRARGRVVFIGSIGGRSALPFLGPYAASKFALEAVADSLRIEVRAFGIEVSIVEPGSIATPIWTKGAATADEIAERSPAETRELYAEPVEMFRRAASAAGRRGESPDAVAKAVEHALTAERPKTRYLVGRDAKRRAFVELLPDRLRDRLLVRYLFESR